MNIAYIRVSTVEQNEERQVKGLERADDGQKQADRNGRHQQRQLDPPDSVQSGAAVNRSGFQRFQRVHSDLLQLIFHVFSS